jgi:hypothetical protein
MRNTTTYLTTTKTVQPPDTVPWWYILFPFIPLLLLPPVVVTTRGRLKITILEGAGEQQPGAQPSDILSEYFKPSVGRLQKNGKKPPSSTKTEQPTQWRSTPLKSRDALKHSQSSQARKHR